MPNEDLRRRYEEYKKRCNDLGIPALSLNAWVRI